MMVDLALKEATAELAATAGYTAPLEMHRLPSRGYQRLFRVEVGRSKLLLKRYFPGGGSRRERLRSEFTFLRFAWSRGVRCIPQPIAADYTRFMALLSYVDGTRLRATDIDADSIEAALRFIADINRRHPEMEIETIESAADTCESIEAHALKLESRFAKLHERADGLGVNVDIRRLIDESLRPLWSRMRFSLEMAAATAQPWSNELRLCPSNFGFHNSLVDARGQLLFFDFPSTGFDDPARLVADVFGQFDYPVAARHWVPFVKELQRALDLPAHFPDRAGHLLPLFGLHRCCGQLQDLLSDISVRGKGQSRAFDPAAAQRLREIQGRILSLESQ